MTRHCLVALIGAECNSIRSLCQIPGLRSYYNGEATLRLVAEVAHNLKHVSVWDSTFEGLEGRTPNLGHGRPEWRGFNPLQDSEWCEVPSTKGQLQSLRIDSAFSLGGPKLATWGLHTDFSF